MPLPVRLVLRRIPGADCVLRAQDNCKFLHIGPPASNTVPQQQMPPQQQQQMPPQHHLQAQQQAPAMMMIPGMGPMHGSMEAMQAYAAQAQEMANQYARQAQAFAHQVAQAQAHQNNYHPQGMPMTSMGMPQMPEAGFIPMVDPGFGPMGPHFGGQPQHQYGAAMPGAQEQAVLYAQKYVCTPTPPKRGESSPQQPCDFFARDGYCLHEANCMFEHVRPEEVCLQMRVLLLSSFVPLSRAAILDSHVGLQEYHPEATSVGDEMPGALRVAEAYSQAEDEQDEHEKHEHEHEHEHAQQENRGGAPEAC